MDPSRMRVVLRAILLLLRLVTQKHRHAQRSYASVPSEMVLGLGLGRPFGGFGAHPAPRPAQQLSIFAGGGYALVVMTHNLGACIRIRPSSPLSPFIIGMYGYNAAIMVQGTDRYNELYYGTTIGVGLELHGRHKPERFFSIQVLLPQRPQAYEDDLENLERNPNVQIEQKPWDVTIAMGYHFGH